MSFAASISHTFTGLTGLVGHRAPRVWTDAPRTYPAVEPLVPVVPDAELEREPVRRPADIARGVEQHRQDLEQWSAAFRFAANFHR